MSLIGFRPYKHLEDEELLNEIYEEMEKLKKISEDDESYKEEVMILNDMIIESKKRDLRAKNETLFRNILS
ncbi:MAG: hypothetical protein FH753_00790 [Firmicutes bacterium]|nr:hypothetical protein [Bacillota bacterium]